MKKILFIFGTRPEAIKLAPLILKMKGQKKNFRVCVCVTGQHRQMLASVLDFFAIKPDYDLKVMKRDQSLFGLTISVLKKIEPVIKKEKPDAVVVQGDTASAYAGALGAYYCQTPIAYIEDGLRSGNKYSPYPEEGYRKIISHLADFHFAPTTRALENLKKENISRNVWVVGNTVIDALFMGLKKAHQANFSKKIFPSIDFSKKIILVTGHRRENYGKPLEETCLALKDLATKNSVQVIYPVHLSPRVQKPVRTLLGNVNSVHLIAPLEYPYMIWLMEKSYLIITDSGGIQEEAISLHKPILVTRKVSERTEGIEAGAALLVGTQRKRIVSEVQKLLHDEKKYEKMSHIENPYGDGRASDRIIRILKKI